MTIQHRQDHNRSIRYDMTGSRILIIAKILKNVIEAITPVLRMLVMKLHDCLYYTGIFTITGDVLKRLLKNIVS